MAPTQCNSPLANLGFNKLLASIAPSDFPAPTKLCISSINKIIFPSLLSISFKILVSLSSNSPLYLAPAINNPKSNSNNVLPFKLVGTSPLTIL